MFISVFWFKFNHSISQQRAAVRSMGSQPLNTDDELWASWAWIIHTQRDCQTVLEWLSLICNNWLIIYTAMIMIIISTIISQQYYSVRIQSTISGRVTRDSFKLAIGIVLRQQELNRTQQVSSDMTISLQDHNSFAFWVCVYVYESVCRLMGHFLHL